MLPLSSPILNQLPIWATLLPLLATFPLLVFERRSPALRDGFAIAISIITFGLVLAMYPAIRSGITLYTAFPELLPPFGISFKADVLGFSLALLASFMWMLCTIYSSRYMCDEAACNRYYPFLLLSLGGCMGVFLTGDLFSLFLFFEVMSLTAYVLIIHNETPAALQAGFQYLMLAVTGGLSLFLGIVITLEVTGTVSLVAGPLFPVINRLSALAFIAYLVGFGIKMGIVPLHVWLPNAHPVAPSPASALLSGIMIKTGAYGLIRVIYQVFGPQMVAQAGWDQIMLILAAVTILVGSALAIMQDDLKRRLAYSSVGQMGYILLGMALLNINGLTGDVYYIFAHALMKSTLFLAAGAILFKTGKKKISELRGIGYVMPITMTCFVIAAFAMIGIPPLNGFVGKVFLTVGVLDAGQFAYAVLLLIGSLMAGVYYLPIIITAFFATSEEAQQQLTLAPPNSRRGWEIGPSMLLPMVVLAGIILLSGIVPDNLALELSRQAANLLLGS